MPAKIIHATQDASGYHFLVHLDTDVTVGSHEAHEFGVAEGSPHPHFVRRWDFANRTPGVHIHADDDRTDLTDAEYHDSIEAMLKEQVALEVQGIRFYQPAPKPHIVHDRFHGREL